MWVLVGIETDRGPWVAALVAAGYRVFAINPRQVARYREWHGTSGAKSDAADAHTLADMVRTDAHQLRPVAGDSALAEGVKVLTRAQRRLADNKRYAARNSTDPSLLQGLCVCASCGYAYYRTSTRTTNKKIYYYRCLGSDDYRYQHGRICANKPVRADYLDALVWNQITGLLTDPTLIRAEIDKRLELARTADPATAARTRLNAGLANTGQSIDRLIGAYQEQLISLDELRARMPPLRAGQNSLRQQIQALDAQLADREIYLQLADSLEDFLTDLRTKAATATVPERQRVLRLLVQDVLVDPDKITIRHRIPIRHSPTDSSPETDSEDGRPRHCQLRWRSHQPAALQREVPSRPWRHQL